MQPAMPASKNNTQSIMNTMATTFQCVPPLPESPVIWNKDIEISMKAKHTNNYTLDLGKSFSIFLLR